MAGFFLFYGAIIAILLYAIYAILDYSGLFYDIVVEIRQHPVGHLRLAYLYSTGHYKNSTRLFKRVKAVAPERRSIGLYYDDTKTTPENEWRYAIGTILSEDDGDPNVDETLMQRLKDDGFRLAEFPAMQTAVTTKFPLRWFLSTFCVLFRVFPKLDNVIKLQGLHAPTHIEIYENDMVYFYRPLSDHDAYLVPEARRK
ncbi:testis-expressed protein 264-like [Diadema antillarum]|uniref:testis-expressed protein 264-like n=1 Tax=Diadema antillarum TaxID=105358 RepID=UPI003A871E95